MGGAAVFRREALEAHAQGRDVEAATVRLGAPWLRWYFWLTLVLVAAGVTVVMLIPVRQSSYGPAIADLRDGRFAALFPAAVAPQLVGARALSFALPGGGLRPIEVTGLRLRLASPATATGAGFSPPNQPAVLLTGRLLAAPPAAGGRLRTEAAMVLPAYSLGSVLAHELKVMLGTGGAAL